MIPLTDINVQVVGGKFFTQNIAARRSKLETLLANLFFFTILFPYTSFGLPIPSDSQPWAVLMGSILIMLSMFKMRSYKFRRIEVALMIMPLMPMLIASAFFLFEGGTSVMYLRTIFKYINFLIVPYATLLYLKAFSTKLFAFSVWTWGIVTTGQVLTRNTLVGFLLPRESIVFGRNFALGFAPEPAYMAKVAVLFLLLTDFFAIEGKISRLDALLLKGISMIMIFLSASLTGLLLLIAYVLILLSLKGKKIVGGLILLPGLLFFVLIFAVFGETIVNYLLNVLPSLGRLGNTIRALLEYRTLLPLFLDASFQNRLGSFLSKIQIIKSGNIFGLGIPPHPVGSILAPVRDSGVMGLMFVLAIVWSFISNVVRLKQKLLRRYSLEIFIMFLLLTFSESLATSYIAFVLGLNFSMTRLYQEGGKFSKR